VENDGHADVVTGSATSLPLSWSTRLKHLVGLDRAIAYTVLGKLLLGLGSVGTVLLIVRFLTPAEQGYYYALWSLVALQSVFELGFSFVILQLAAHERAHLEFFADGSVAGDPVAHARLASILQRAVRWYACAAVIMVVALLIGGTYFFSAHQQSGVDLTWHAPLRLAVFACALTFWIGPVLSFLEGCGQVAAVAHMRLFQSIVGTTAAWCAMLSHHGLFAPAMVLIGWGIVASVFLYSRRALLLPLLQFPGTGHAVSWRREIWPFQWKIAVSWLCDYFIFQLFTPVLFAFRGPVEAGRMGLSMSIVIQMSGIILAWMSTKAAPFGGLVARRDVSGLDSLFFRTLWQSLGLFSAAVLAVLSCVVIVDRYWPLLGNRMVSWPIFLLLLLTAISSHIVQSEALYLRAHKCEPFLIQSIVIAASTAISVTLLAKPWGTVGVSFAYFVVLGILGVISATFIFRRKRREWAILAKAQLVKDGDREAVLAANSGTDVELRVC
jgi:hypothetical protein